MLGQYKYAVGKFSNRISAEHALKVLTTSGVQTDQISIFVIDAEHDEQFGEAGINVRDWYKAYDGTATCATITGSLLGAVVGCLIGLGLLVVPGVGPFLLIGTSGTTLATTIAGTGVGLASGSLISAISSLRTTSEQGGADSEHVLQNNYLLIVKGTKEEVRHAESILSRWCKVLS